MKILKTVSELKAWRSSLEGKLGFVPTMGALHEGHLSLIRKSTEDNLVTLVSLFVNPTQFNDQTDFSNYPNTLTNDLELLKDLNVDAVFIPQKENLYPDNYTYKIKESEFSNELCGKHRPGHFDGVLTVVLKLLNLAQSDRAYFGEKDYQQLKLIKGMAEAFFLPTEIIGVPTVRETDGLAMSSRNALLSPENREKAPLLFSTLNSSLSPEEARGELEKNGFDVDYLEETDGRRFVAAKLGNVRLIDNV